MSRFLLGLCCGLGLAIAAVSGANDLMLHIPAALFMRDDYAQMCEALHQRAIETDAVCFTRNCPGRS